MPINFSDEQIRFARGMVRYFSSEWFAEIPTKIHVGSHVYDDSGAPVYTDEFINYIDDSVRSGKREDRPRRPHDIARPRRAVTEAFRTLRRRAPFEYDAMNCLTVIDQVGRHSSPNADDPKLIAQFEASLRATAERFNLRAIKRGDSQRFTSNDILLLVISAVEKLSRWAG